MRGYRKEYRRILRRISHSPAIVVASHDARANHDRYRGTIQHTERTNAVVPVAGETLRYIRRRQAHVREIRRVEPMRTGRTEAAEFGPKFSDVYAFDVPHHDQVIPRIRHVIGVTMRRGRVVVVRRCRKSRRRRRRRRRRRWHVIPILEQARLAQLSNGMRAQYGPAPLEVHRVVGRRRRRRRRRDARG